MLAPIFVRDHFAELESVGRPETNVRRAAELGYKALGLANPWTVSSAPDFIDECLASEIKPIIGMEVSHSNTTFCVYARNLEGWRELLGIASDGKFEARPYLNLVAVGWDLTEVAHLFDPVYTVQGVPIAPTLFPCPEDAEDYRTIQAIKKNCAVKEIGQADLNCTILSPDQLAGSYNQEQRRAIEYLVGVIESFSVKNHPILPKFPVPGGGDPNDFLRELCRVGWRQKVKDVIPKEQQAAYAAQVKLELEVLLEANLADYFLITQDYIQWAKDRGYYVGKGRGSVGASLVAYLLGITGFDPMPENLVFTRFYNKGRNEPGKVYLPDIDTDFETTSREPVITYIRDRYGSNYVAQNVTYGRMMGRSITRNVLRVHKVVMDSEINKIAKHIPDEAKISDQLQEMEEKEGVKSIVRWALQHNRADLSEWVTLGDDGKCYGQLGHYFEQAMRLEGQIRNKGKHASALVICGVPIRQVAPLVKDKEGELVVGVEYTTGEAMGLPKFDILGLNSLDKKREVVGLIANAKVHRRS